MVLRPIRTPFAWTAQRRSARTGLRSFKFPVPAALGFGTAFFLSLSSVFVILIFLLWEAAPFLYQNGWGFLTHSRWQPGVAYGALAMIYVTFLVTFIALLLAIPVGVLTAVVTSEYLSGNLRLLIKSALELLAGIPGVVYGLLGILFLVPWVQHSFGVIDGHTILAAGGLLGIMILPLILTLADDVLQSVPGRYREQAYALGFAKPEVILHAVLPHAAQGMLGSSLLAASRAMGETIAVMLVIGSIDRIPQPFYNIFAPAQTITSKLGREAAEALGTPGHWNALMALGLILFVTVMLLTIIGELIYGVQKPFNGDRQTNHGEAAN